MKMLDSLKNKNPKTNKIPQLNKISSFSQPYKNVISMCNA